MELASDQHMAPPGGIVESESLTSLACTCLLSLVVARGDTGKLLSAVAAMLMSPPALATQQMKVATSHRVLKLQSYLSCIDLSKGVNVCFLCVF